LKSPFYHLLRVVSLLLFALIVTLPYVGAQAVMNIQNTTTIEPNQKTPESSTEDLRRILAQK
jgi:hypothetical protein